MKSVLFKLLVGALLALVVLTVILLVGMYATAQFRPPTDESLRTLYREHRSEFATLRDMLSAEPNLLSVGDDNVGKFWLLSGKWEKSSSHSKQYTETERLKQVGMRPERYHSYLKLLQSVGGFRVSKVHGPIAVHIARAGIVPAGYIKSIVFSSAPPGPIVPDTAAYARNSPSGEGICYAKIEDGWYIEYDWR